METLEQKKIEPKETSRAGVESLRMFFTTLFAPRFRAVMMVEIQREETRDAVDGTIDLALKELLAW